MGTEPTPISYGCFGLLGAILKVGAFSISLQFPVPHGVGC